MTGIQKYSVTKQMRENKNGHKAFTVWFTGLSGAGKSTLANMLEQYLFEEGKHVFVLDGDNIRNGINKGLSFSKADRSENIRRVAEIASLFCEAGTITIAAFISPYAEDRQMAREIIGVGNFIEVFLDADISTCAQRDVKGLYTKAKAGLIQEFTGISDVYEVPENPDLVLHTGGETTQASLQHLISWLHNNNLLA
jgi:adenylylsulfate kinase